MRVLVLLAAVLLLAPLSAATGPAGPTRLVPQEGPDVPTTSAPVAVLTPFQNDAWSFTEGVRSRDIIVPTVAWDRVVVTFHDDSGTDPWDRLYGVGIAGAEVLHGTTPRAPMTVTKDVTSYAALLVPGSTVPITLHFGTWVGVQRLSVTLSFYDEASAAAVEGAHTATLAPFEFAGMCCEGSVLAANVAFPATQPSRATLELTTSGHGQDGEFWWMSTAHPTPPSFHVFVDGQEIAVATAMPYTYALVGVSPENVVDTAVHGAIWWTAQQGADAAGVHTGTGEIPPYRAQLPADVLPLLSGARDVRVVESWNAGEGGSWPVSLTFHVDA